MDSMEIFQFNPLNPSAENVLINIRSQAELQKRITYVKQMDFIQMFYFYASDLHHSKQTYV